MFFFFFGAVFAAVLPSVAPSAASAIVATSGPRSEPLCAPLGDSTAPEPSSNALSAFTDDESYDVTSIHNTLLSVLQPACPNPAPIAVTQCALYSLPEEASSCTNFGQHIGPSDANGEAFKIAIRSSNAYNKVFVKQVTVTFTTTHHMHETFTRLLSRRQIATTTVNGDQTVNMTTTVTRHRSSKTKPVAVATPAGVVTVTRSANPTSYAGTVTVTRSANPTAHVGTVTVTRSKSTGLQPSQVQSVIYTTVTSYYDKRAEPYTAPADCVTVTVEGEPTYVSTTTTTLFDTSGVVTVTTTIPNTLPAETTTITIDDAESRTYPFNDYPGKRSLVTRIMAKSESKASKGTISPLTAVTSVKGPAVTAEPMSTFTIDENYVYTGPTDVPMQTFTIYLDH
ncbi:hypothetical protein J4E91_004497 [Alternaria rosae]|nr:hypothetical protein J4E91_004497 [Alternaria rosae]